MLLNICFKILIWHMFLEYRKVFKTRKNIYIIRKKVAKGVFSSYQCTIIN